MEITGDQLRKLADKAIVRWLTAERIVGHKYGPNFKPWRPIDRSRAREKWDGFADALDTIGLGSTPMAVWMDVAAAVQVATAQHGERPAWRTINNADMRAWDQAAGDLLLEHWLSQSSKRPLRAMQDRVAERSA